MRAARVSFPGLSFFPPTFSVLAIVIRQARRRAYRAFPYVSPAGVGPAHRFATTRVIGVLSVDEPRVTISGLGQLDADERSPKARRGRLDVDRSRATDRTESTTRSCRIYHVCRSVRVYIHVLRIIRPRRPHSTTAFHAVQFSAFDFRNSRRHPRIPTLPGTDLFTLRILPAPSVLYILQRPVGWLIARKLTAVRVRARTFDTLVFLIGIRAAIATSPPPLSRTRN